MEGSEQAQPDGPALVQLNSFELGLSSSDGSVASDLARLSLGREWGYDVLVRVIQATDLPGNDWW